MMDIDNFSGYIEQQLEGRYVTPEAVNALLLTDSRRPHVSVIGHSVLDRPIYAYRFGTGAVKVLMWSQMHGNESTTTKALFDMFNFFEAGSDEAGHLLKTLSICVVPMLNPDGAAVYTRNNANDVDLNRDFVDFSQPESRALQKLYEDFGPDYCFNLHDQRTIFGVGDTNLPATVSFLSPSYNEACDVNTTRRRAMAIIVAMNKTLQQLIPGQIGRFDDGFNPQCVGDHFQILNTPTVLFEAGHFQKDYGREKTRAYLFIALMSGLSHISENVVVADELSEYSAIPQNNARFCDFVYKNVRISYDGIEIITNFAAQYKEELIDGIVHFNAYISEKGNLDKVGHLEYDANGAPYCDDTTGAPVIGNKANFFLGDVMVVNGQIKA